MTRAEFMTSLRAGLAGHVSAKEINRLCDYYDEMILDLIDAGRSEAEAVAAMGSVPDLVYAACDGQPVPAKRRSWTHNPWAWLVIILGAPLWGSVLLAVGGIGLAVEAVFWCIPFTGAMLAGGLTIGGLWAALMAVPASFAVMFYGVSELGIGLMCIGGGLLAGWLTWLITKYAIKAHAWAFRQLAAMFIKPKEVIA